MVDIIYTGIGSRETPREIQYRMSGLSYHFSKVAILRSGGADGADKAFEIGHKIDETIEIYIPWKNFNNSVSDLVVTEFENFQTAKELASELHPAWNRCSEKAKLLHTRNIYQILGRDLNKPSDFVVCWTKDGKASGGTGQALRLAYLLDIPVFNFYHDTETAEERIIKHINEIL